MFILYLILLLLSLQSNKIFAKVQDIIPCAKSIRVHPLKLGEYLDK